MNRYKTMNTDFSKLRIALLHEWFVDIAGAEQVFKKLYALFPQARIFTLFHKPESLAEMKIPETQVTDSFLQNIPGICRNYRKFLPIFPMAVGSLDVSDFDLIVSSSHSAIKGVRMNPGQIHICYCHTPPRYLWDMSDTYLKHAGLDKGPIGLASHAALHFLRRWDAGTSKRVDHFIANSSHTAWRIEKFYGRNSKIIHPPVNTSRFHPSIKKDYFLFSSRLVNYKRADLAIESCARTGDRLIIAGEGPELKSLRFLGAEKNVEFAGHLKDSAYSDLMSEARALIFPAEEDFGITMAEALASGTPVIAYGKGGARDILEEHDPANGKEGTGIFFNAQNVSSLANSIERFKTIEKSFNSGILVSASKKFDEKIFTERFSKFVKSKVFKH